MSALNTLRYTVLCLAAVLPQVALAGVLYTDPDAGWRYRYDGTFHDGLDGLPPGYGRGNDTEALDGTWIHDQADKWDGSGPGDPLSDPLVDPLGTSPGGVAALEEAGTSFVRVQDTGNPEDHGWQQGNIDPQNTNRRIFFAHDMQQDGILGSELVLDNGITISTRIRIPTSGPLDDIYTVDEEGNAVVLPWGSLGGGGYPIHNEGRGMFNVLQNNADFFDQDSSIGFSLMTSADVALYCDMGANSDLCLRDELTGGLTMNHLIGATPFRHIDTFDEGTLNLLEIDDADLHSWREFWITIEKDGVVGTHKVDVYMDGSDSPTTFHVTSTTDNQSSYNDGAFLTFGLNFDAMFGVFDMDFFAYQLGVIEPEAADLDPACDLNGDGSVDAADAGIMFGNWGGSGVGDKNDDGIVDAADAGIMFSQWTGDASHAASVPEPALLLRWIGLPLIAACRHATRGKSKRRPSTTHAAHKR